MKNILAFLLLVLFIGSTSCSKCKVCDVTSTTKLKQDYAFPVEGVPSTSAETVELCEDRLEAVDGKTIGSDSLYNGIEITVTRTYDCK